MREDPILKTKHSLDLSLVCMDARFRQLAGVDEPSHSFYSLVHPVDIRYIGEFAVFGRRKSGFCSESRLLSVE